MHSTHYSEKPIKHRLHVCEQEEGKWKRVDGTNLGGGFNRWKEGAPDGGAEENCAVMQVGCDWLTAGHVTLMLALIGPG